MLGIFNNCSVLGLFVYYSVITELLPAKVKAINKSLDIVDGKSTPPNDAYYTWY